MTFSILTLLNFQNAIVGTALTYAYLESLLNSSSLIQKMPITMVNLISGISFIDKLTAILDLAVILNFSNGPKASQLFRAQDKSNTFSTCSYQISVDSLLLENGGHLEKRP